MILYLYLGRIGYGEGLALQRELVELRHQGRIGNVLLLLEHPPVLTLGRNASRANILATDEILARKGVEVHEINRGGDVTYHGPGQLVGYPVFDLRSLRSASGSRLGPVDFVRRMEDALIALCVSLGVRAGRVASRTGVWTGVASASQPSATGPFATGCEKKIAAIGVHVSRGITSHGFALNVTTDLRDFQWIVPCGIADRDVTSIELEIPTGEPLPSLEQLADATARHFGHVFGQPVLAIESLEALREQAATARSSEQLPNPVNPFAPQPEIQQIGVPMRVPAEIQRLREDRAPHTEKSVQA